MSIVNLIQKTFVVLKSLILFILASSSCFAEPRKEIHVVTEYTQNYQFKTSEGKLSGFAVEVVERLLDRTGFSANIDVLPWSRAFKIASEEKNTMIFSIAFTERRQQYFTWIGMLSREPLSIWGLKKKFSSKVLALDNLKSYYFVTIRDTNADNILVDHGFPNIFRVATQNQLLGMLFKNRADLLISGRKSMQVRTKVLGYSFTDLEPVYDFEDVTSNLGIAFNIDSDPKLIDIFKNAFIEMEQSGELYTIKLKWNISG